MGCNFRARLLNEKNKHFGKSSDFNFLVTHDINSLLNLLTYFISYNIWQDLIPFVGILFFKTYKHVVCCRYGNYFYACHKLFSAAAVATVFLTTMAICVT
jgi:hypothetical protein